MYLFNLWVSGWCAACSLYAFHEHALWLAVADAALALLNFAFFRTGTKNALA